MPRIVTFNKRLLKTPYVLLALAVALAAWQRDWWFLTSAPLIYLGWACSAPNLNLADGFLPQLILAIALMGTAAIRSSLLMELGLACWVSWLVCSLELAIVCELKSARCHEKGDAKSHVDADS